MRIEVYRAYAGFSDTRFCCFCGLRISKHRPSTAGQDWDCETVRRLAARWLANDARTIEEWIGPDGHAERSIAKKLGPMLEFLLSKLRGIARRRRERISRALSAANQDFAAIWHAEQVLDAARTPYEDEGADLPVGFIYAISNGTHLKIGWSTRHPELSRLQDLQVASAHELQVVGAFVGTQRDEQAAHRHFSDHRVRGEWFVDVPQIREYFKTQSESNKNASHSA
jgi:Meiotically up-regulated gene 113